MIFYFCSAIFLLAFTQANEKATNEKLIQDGLQKPSNIPNWCDVINRLATFKLFVILSLVMVIICDTSECNAEEFELAKVVVQENSGIHRDLEYVVGSLQLQSKNNDKSEFQIIAIDRKNNKRIACQVFNHQFFQKENLVLLEIIFPVSINANEKKNYTLMKNSHSDTPVSDLSYKGSGLELIIENKFYSVDLTRSDQSEAKNHSSGQLRELFIKMGFNTRLFRTENRMHWAPNFQNREYTEYETIAGWDNPEIYVLDTGPYLIHTMRSDHAPRHAEIQLTANYYFYAGLPYFKFHSSMELIENLWLFLLRNDEMTMDSLFTHVAFQRPNGIIENQTFSGRYKRLEDNPIENNAPWLCFYNAEKGYAFGSIRLRYDLNNEKGFTSPTYLPHTKISDGAGGGKYWNRRLIHEFPIFVPIGSRYIEENAYLVFKVGKKNKFEDIQNWSRQLKNPLRISIIQP
jgi:hypothetical protein